MFRHGNGSFVEEFRTITFFSEGQREQKAGGCINAQKPVCKSLIPF